VKKGKQQVVAFIGGVAGAFPEGLKSEIRKVYADGDAVILETVNRGTSATGKAYENEYCFVFEVSGGKIQTIREYVEPARLTRWSRSAARPPRG
jgi:ketosteroid isomerase-like protein